MFGSGTVKDRVEAVVVVGAVVVELVGCGVDVEGCKSSGSMPGKRERSS